MCCSVLQCVAVCCSTYTSFTRVLQCVAVCCSVLQCSAVCCSVLPCVAVCCSTHTSFARVLACSTCCLYQLGSMSIAAKQSQKISSMVILPLNCKFQQCVEWSLSICTSREIRLEITPYFLCDRCGKFSKVSSVVILCGKFSGALTFEKLYQPRHPMYLHISRIADAK